MIARGFDMGDDGAPFMSQDPNGWVARFALYGPTTIVDAQYDIVSSALSAIAGVEVSRRQFEGTDIETQRNHDERVQRGVPDMDLLNPDFLPYGADTAHLDFSPVGPATGEAVVRTERLINELYAAHGHMYVNAVYLNARSALHVSTTFFDPRDADETAGVYAGYRDLVEKVAATGDAPYRTNLQHMDQVAALFDFGDHAQLRVNQVLKDALDPNGILAPGKSGIWPRHLRTD
jgi:4-cresol dehydrogenase (hydroxylating)